MPGRGAIVPAWKDQLMYNELNDRERKKQGLRIVNRMLLHVYRDAADAGLNTNSSHPLVDASAILLRCRSELRRSLGIGPRR